AEDTKAAEKGWNNQTDAAGMAALMTAVARSPLLSETARRTAWETLAAQTYHDMIPDGLPKDSGAVVAHKTGSISSVEHDAALVRLANGRTYVLVILTTD